MSEKNRLTDEQLDGISGGQQLSVTLDGVTIELGGPDTYLHFSELEREGASVSGSYFAGNSHSAEAIAYFDWYYSYYKEPHPWDQR